jgi:hypothetical protein
LFLFCPESAETRFFLPVKRKFFQKNSVVTAKKMAAAEEPPPEPETATPTPKRRDPGTSGHSCAYCNGYQCRCTSRLCPAPRSVENFSASSARFGTVPFPRRIEMTVPDEETGLPVVLHGINIQLRLLHEDLALRARVVTITGLVYRPERSAPWFICACHLDADSIIRGQRKGSWVLAPGQVPLTPRQMLDRAAPATLLPEMRAAASGRFEELAVVLHQQDIKNAGYEGQIAALKCVSGVLFDVVVCPPPRGLRSPPLQGLAGFGRA